ncbi:hypothetical protein [Clostridium sp. M14]|uniref:hypothetical protein n=1 Tax=Clostridium sp. M14 TaxID=2716311 RepID=UPI0013EEAB92|nr:hypothetical protein [Clostridium sp. M14]MBZ9690748.1 hypothetical protein [Clostridium sp. M14]
MFNLEDSINTFIGNFNPLNIASTMEILDRLEKYKKLDLKRISDKELFDLTLKTIPCCNVIWRNYKEGLQFFRVRKLEEDAYLYSKDLIYPPKKYVKVRGKLNDIRESMLYVSRDQVTPFYEVKAKVGERYAMIGYEVVQGENIQATVIGLNNSYSNEMKLNEQGNINSRIIEQFFYTEFTKDVGKGTEHLYRTSTMLAKNFFDVPNCDAYEYPSVAINRNINLAIKPQAVDKKLKIISVENIEITGMDERNIKFNRISTAQSITSGKIEYKKF